MVISKHCFATSQSITVEFQDIIMNWNSPLHGNQQAGV